MGFLIPKIPMTNLKSIPIEFFVKHYLWNFVVWTRCYNLPRFCKNKCIEAYKKIIVVDNNLQVLKIIKK